MPGPSFAKSPPELVARFDELAALVPDATRRPMFGYPSCTIGGNMFMSLFADGLILRLSEADRIELIETHKGAGFQPMPGRPMKEYVVAPRELVGTPAIKDWVGRAHAYAVSLPAKQPKASTPKAVRTKR